MEYAETPPEYVARADGVQLAYRYLPGRDLSGDGPTLIFLPGYMSDMKGSKAQALEAWAKDQGRAMLRLDYSGCGESGGDFADSSFTQWRDDVLTVIDAAGVNGPVILAGSSMGGWLMLILALAMGSRVSALVGIAAAPDFTAWGFSPAQKAAIVSDGVIYQDNPYGPAPTPTHRRLYEDGEAQLMLTGQIPIDCPVRLLHGQQDADVPWKISLKLAAALRSSDVQLCLVKDGDHRLSRSSDIALLIDSIARLPV